eukprot:scaffold15695_cov160-Amphora_coffeaeformis.AAC.2
MSSPPDSLPSSSLSCASSVAGHSRSRSDSDIRGKLLNRLGIYDVPATAHAQPMTAAQHRRLRILRGMGVGYYANEFSPPDGSATRSPLNGVKKFVEPLKTDDVRKTPMATVGKKKSTKIAFQDQVEVLPIPTRYEYSERIKSRIWSNRHELQENAERNALEFASEGWDWKNVKEDDHMFICSQSGELVHPVHLQHLMQQEEQGGPSLERGQPVHS